jgi:hypothetical protein
LLAVVVVAITTVQADHQAVQVVVVLAVVVVLELAALMAVLEPLIQLVVVAVQVQAATVEQAQLALPSFDI